MFINLFKSRKGQLGPQGLEDLPLVIMAFIIAVCAIILFLTIVTNHLEESQNTDVYNVGKRLVETLSGEAFKSDISRAYGSQVLDYSLISKAYDNNSLQDIIQILEYNFSAEISSPTKSWTFGETPPENFMVFKDKITLLSDNSLENGEITVKIW